MGQGLEEEQVAGVVVGADRLWVRVDHHRFQAQFAHGEGGLDAAVVELDPLADAVGPAADDDDLGPLAQADFVLQEGRGQFRIFQLVLGVVVDHRQRRLVGRVVVRRVGLELRRTRVHQLVDRRHLQAPANLPHLPRGHAPRAGQLHVAVAPLLGPPDQVRHHGRLVAGQELFAGGRPFLIQRRAADQVAGGQQFFLEVDELLHLRQEPRVEVRQLVDLLDRPACLERVPHVIQPPLARDRQLAAELVRGNRPLLVEALALGRLVAVVGGVVGGVGDRRRVDVGPARGGGLRPAGVQPLVVPVQAEPEPLDLHRPDALLQRLLERPADRHRLANALHLRRQRLVGVGELLERPARDLDDAVVDRRLEASRRVALVAVAGAGAGVERVLALLPAALELFFADAGDVVGQLVQRVADGELGRELGDGVAGRLAGQGRRA